MRVAKRILFVLLLIGVFIQFSKPVKNVQNTIPGTDIARLYSMPVTVSGALRNSCYDCHSNNTHYPWYAQIQPAAWYMTRHIKNGKKDLNFNEFGTYSNRKQQSKLRAIASAIKDGTMPISSYLMIHKDAKLTELQKTLIVQWATATKDSIATKE
jgi:hypothetical protein